MGLKASAEKLGLADLARSGISAAVAKRLGVKFLSPSKTAELLPKFPVESMLIPYYSPDGKKREDVFRLKLIGTVTIAFGAEKKLPKYVQPQGTPVAAYLPPLLPWGQIFKDPKAQLIITEGEKKAVSACLHGFATIGLGGVWSWKSRKLGCEFLPELEAIKWHKRRVFIIFDSDMMEKPDVVAAAAQLRRKICGLGADARIVVLPDLYEGVDEGKKTGLDDFLVALDELGKRTKDGTCGKAGLEAALTEALTDGLSSRLWSYNERYAVIENPTAVVDEHAAEGYVLYDVAKFHTIRANDKAMKVVTPASGSTPEKRKEVDLSHEWLEWPSRRTFLGLAYKPGEGTVTDRGLWNTWRGLAVEPVKGDIGPWRRLLDLIFKGAGAEEKKWFEQWCGYPFKFPGMKLSSAAVLWSRTQGLGKSTIAQTLAKIYGQNSVTLNHRVFDSNHNDWQAGKQFVLVDDISPHDRHRVAEMMKTLITQESVLVNPKYITPYTIADCCNYFLTSNHENALTVEEHDRRLFIHEVTAERPSNEFYDAFYDWQGGSGPAHLLHHFLEGLDYEGFRPKSPPPLTAAKLSMIEAVKPELDAWVEELPETAIECDLWATQKLTDRFNASAIRKVVPRVMGRLLARKYQQTRRWWDKDANASSPRFFIIRNLEKWGKAQRKECEAELMRGMKY